MQHLLPRVMEIIYEIDQRFLRELIEKRWPDNPEYVERLSIIESGPQPMVRMAHLAIVGSFSVNGVAELHSNLLKRGLFSDFHALWPTLLEQQDQRRHTATLATRLQHRSSRH